MRRYTSVLMLGARGVVMPLIGVLLLMSAAEAGLVFWELSGGWILERFWSAGYVVWAYRAALVLLAAACCVHVSGLGGSRVYYTMHRLRISEWTVTVLLGLCYTAAFVVLWAVQAGILTAVTAYCAARAGAGAQAVFLISWNDDFFHAMLPLGQWTGYVRQLLLALGMGMSCAVWSFWRRRNSFGYAAPIMVIAAAVFTGLGCRDFVVDISLGVGACIVVVCSLYFASVEVSQCERAG